MLQSRRGMFMRVADFRHDVAQAQLAPLTRRGFFFEPAAARRLKSLKRTMRCGDIVRKHPRSMFPTHTRYLAPLLRGFSFVQLPPLLLILVGV